MLQKQLHTTKRSLNVPKFQNTIVRRNGKLMIMEKRYGLAMVIANL
jgi:ribosomal protein L36